MTDMGEAKKEKKKINKKLLIILIAAVLVLAAVAIVLVVLHRRRAAMGDDVYVDTVAAIMGEEGDGGGNRYAGVTESKQSWQVNLAAGNSVGKVHVAVGDAVKKGDPLFTYDTNQLNENKTQAEIELQRLKNERSSISSMISQLNQEKRAAGAGDQGSYTIQIQEEELEAKQKDIEIQEKSKELAKINKAVKEATVKSEIDGVVKSINNAQASSADAGEEDIGMEDAGMEDAGETAFMTIMQTDELRIKASANEQNIAELEEGAAVVVHSRVDDTTWKGKISKIDSETPQQNTQNEEMMEEEGDSEETGSSSYPFYVDLESSEGLMLGQHVYIELDRGGGSRDGIWLDEAYILDVDSDPYVLAEDSRGKLKKRSVTLGDYDEELMQYEITDGLTKKDRIAMPDMAGEE